MVGAALRLHLLMNAYVVFSENPVSVHINNLKAIKHDTILVLALGGDIAAGQWSPVERIDTSKSEEFCRRCGAALGWLLKGENSPAGIRAAWRGLIQ